jgi:hypothetical protein
VAAADADLTRRIRDGANVIAEGVKRRAAWSETIPGSVRVRVTGLSFTISAGGAEAPSAYPNEAPARRGKQAGVPVNHPLWGNREHWYPQRPRPFMLPAAEEDSDKALEAVAAVVNDWGRQNGFTGTG